MHLIDRARSLYRDQTFALDLDQVIFAPDSTSSAFARRDIRVPICELVDANVAECGISVWNSRLHFTSVIAKSVAGNQRRRSVFRSLCNAQVFIS